MHNNTLQKQVWKYPKFSQTRQTLEITYGLKI